MSSYSGPFLGKYGTQAGGSVTMHWTPDPMVFANKLMDVSDALEDRSIPLFMSAAIVQRDIAENFAGEHDPSGQAWEPWSTAMITRSTGKVERGTYTDPVTGRTSNLRGYAENLPKGHSGKILDRWGELRRTATSSMALDVVAGETVNSDSLFYNTGGLPDYWEWHQDGVVGRVPGGDLPQRRFLGLSGEAEYQILEAFDEWFQETLERAVVRESAVSSRGKMFTRARIPKGQPGAGRFAKAG